MNNVSISCKIAFQGERGAYSHQACLKIDPDCQAIPCNSFNDAVQTVKTKQANLAVLPIENSIHGRVVDMHRLLPQSGLVIVGETFLRINISLLAHPQADLDSITRVVSHNVLLNQCQTFLQTHSIDSIPFVDTAGAARYVSEQNDLTLGAMASDLAGQIYGLLPLKRNVEDTTTNTTRFIVMANKDSPFDLPRALHPPQAAMYLTSFVFRVRNIPAALYKVMGGFATNAVNMINLQSDMIDSSFTATQFYAEIEGKPDALSVCRAFEELQYFADHFVVLGTYPADAYRQNFQH